MIDKLFRSKFRALAFVLLFQFLLEQFALAYNMTYSFSDLFIALRINFLAGFLFKLFFVFLPCYVISLFILHLKLRIFHFALLFVLINLILTYVLIALVFGYSVTFSYPMGDWAFMMTASTVLGVLFYIALFKGKGWWHSYI